LSKHDTDTAFDTAKQRAEALLKDCEWQQTQLKVEISLEYDEMKTGYSDLYSLLVGAERIAEDGLQLLEIHF